MAEQVSETMSGLSEFDLRQGFESFMEASGRLEKSYSELRARAEAIDLELAVTNEKLAATLSEREAVFSAMPVGVAALSAEGEVSWCNPEATRLISIASECAVDLTTARPGQFEIANVVMNVKKVHLPCEGILLVIEDRSKLVGLEREVNRLDRLAGLSELALGVAHEIKNPLNGVVGFASLMQRSQDPETLRRFAAKILDGLRQVDEIVKAMLAFAKPQSKCLAIAELSKIVVEAAALAGLDAQSLRMHGDLHAEAQSFALVRVLTNLFRNSIEAIPGGKVEIDVQVENLEECLQVLVQDNGPGIAADLGDRIFEPFVSTKDRGHGLGLALSCRVISFLGGSVELAAPGQDGACFKLRLPHCGRSLLPRPSLARPVDHE